MHLTDAEVDRETGRVQIKRYTVIQDAGKAIHLSTPETKCIGAPE